MAQNPVEQLKKGELPKRPEVKKDFLDADEVVMLADVPCSRKVVKQAFMFCCFTSLRYSYAWQGTLLKTYDTSTTFRPNTIETLDYVDTAIRPSKR